MATSILPQDKSIYTHPHQLSTKNSRSRGNHPWLSEINAPVGYQEVAGHTYKWLLLIG